MFCSNSTLKGPRAAKLIGKIANQSLPISILKKDRHVSAFGCEQNPIILAELPIVWARGIDHFGVTLYKGLVGAIDASVQLHEHRSARGFV